LQQSEKRDVLRGCQHPTTTRRHPNTTRRKYADPKKKTRSPTPKRSRSLRYKIQSLKQLDIVQAFWLLGNKPDWGEAASMVLSKPSLLKLNHPVASFSKSEVHGKFKFWFP
jgi:hypothetical protein